MRKINHKYSFQVRGYELDSFGHVNNAVYLNYLEEERWWFFKDTKWIDYMKENSLYPVVVETNIEYIRELKLFDEAEVISEWSIEGEHLIAKQNIYFANTKKKVAKAIVKMMLVSRDRLVFDLPDFMKQKLSDGHGCL